MNSFYFREGSELVATPFLDCGPCAPGPLSTGQPVGLDPRSRLRSEKRQQASAVHGASRVSPEKLICRPGPGK